MILYRFLERLHSSSIWVRYGVAYQDDRGRVLLFVPAWRSPKLFLVSSLFNLNEEHFPQSPYQFRWCDEIYAWDKDDELFHPIEAMSASTMQYVSWKAYRRELPQLLQLVPGKWVAFHGERQVALGSSKREVYEQLEQTGCPLQEVIVRCIEPLEPAVDLRRFYRVLVR